MPLHPGRLPVQIGYPDILHETEERIGKIFVKGMVFRDETVQPDGISKETVVPYGGTESVITTRIISGITAIQLLLVRTPERAVKRCVIFLHRIPEEVPLHPEVKTVIFLQQKILHCIISFPFETEHPAAVYLI